MSTLSVRGVETAQQETPRERLLRSGGGALNDTELLSLVLSGGRDPGVAEPAETLLEHSGGLAGLLQAGEQLPRVPGVGRARRAAVLAAIELARRFAAAKMPRRALLDSPAEVASYLAMRYGQADQEIMGALYLDARNRLIAEVEVYRGTLNRTAVEPRAILKQALARGANSFILFHTHPSGDPSPSEEDLNFTHRMQRSGALLGIRLEDHLILGGGGRWVSLRRRGGW